MFNTIMIGFLLIVEWVAASFTFINLAILTLQIMILTFIKIQNLATLLWTIYFLIKTLIKMLSVLFKRNLLLINGAMFLITLNKLFISILQSNLYHRLWRKWFVSAQWTLVSSFIFFPLSITIFETHCHFALLANLRLICIHFAKYAFKWI